MSSITTKKNEAGIVIDLEGNFYDYPEEIQAQQLERMIKIKQEGEKYNKIAEKIRKLISEYNELALKYKPKSK